MFSADVDRALTDERSLLIATLNRGTLHLVRSEDYPWLQALMTPRPGRVARVYEIDLPRPRTIEMTFEPSFISLVQEIKVAVESGGRHTLEVE